MKSLENLLNKELKKIFSTIEKEIKITKNKFYDNLSDTEEEFTL